MKLSQSDISRIIEMAWEDRTPFDAIESQFKLSHDDVVKLMRQNLKNVKFNKNQKVMRTHNHCLLYTSPSPRDRG